jgi:hypothetical protein
MRRKHMRRKHMHDVSKYEVGQLVELTTDKWRDLPRGTRGRITSVIPTDTYPVRILWEVPEDSPSRWMYEQMFPNGSLIELDEFRTLPDDGTPRPRFIALGSRVRCSSPDRNAPVGIVGTVTDMYGPLEAAMRGYDFIVKYDPGQNPKVDEFFPEGTPERHGHIELVEED